MARFLGIDIGDNALRGVLVRSALRKLEVERYVEIPLTAAPDSPGRLPELAEAGRNLLRALASAPDAIVGGVAGEETSLRVLELPAAARKRIAEVLPFELETHAAVRSARRGHRLPADRQRAGRAARAGGGGAAPARGARRSSACARPGSSRASWRPAPPRSTAWPTCCPSSRSQGPVLRARRRATTAPTCASCRAGHCVNARTIDFGIERHAGAAPTPCSASCSARSRASAPPASTRRRPCTCAATGARAEGAVAWLVERARRRRCSCSQLPRADATRRRRPSPVFGKAAALAARARGRRPPHQPAQRRVRAQAGRQPADASTST